MLVLLKLIAVFGLLVALIRKGVNVGVTLFAGGVALALLFGMGAWELAATAFDSSTGLETLELLAMVLLITLLGAVLKHMENLHRTVEALEKLVGDVRVVLAAVPAFIGLMPMPGGAMLSAPLTGEVADKVGLNPDVKTLVNYWFRHIWEYTFPLYPGIILSTTIFGITFRDIILSNGLLNVIAVAVGYYLLLRGIRHERAWSGDAVRNLGELAAAVWPVAAVITVNILLGIHLVVALLAVLLVLFLQSRFFRGFRDVVFRESITLNLTVLILGVMFFKAVIEESHAADTLPGLFMEYNIPVAFIVFALPFIIGLLVGYTAAYVGTTFPLLAVFISDGGFDFSLFMLAYVGGFMGVMLSPVHLCLVLSREYYGGDFKNVYRMLVPLVALVVAAAAVLYVLDYPNIAVG